MSRARFITLEGIEGVGKSTQLKFITDYLKQKNIPLTVTREPGGTPLAEAIRELVLTFDPSKETITPDSELLLFFAARAQHIHTVIEPALARGDWVICDRFIETSYAYQGGGRGIDLAFIQDLQKWVQKDLKIDCVLLLDAPVELALKRTHRRKHIDRIESETADFFNRARDTYLARAKQTQNNYHVIDASLPLKEVQKQIQLILDKLLQHG
ncbi:dTMP kinase [Rickettsiella endosymbiont of Dermanyssus gallinae]|uniref:dTMP kinase n=1 Tax=Rickettsiella endosymbiont of Dermanyssus gallinae TaxID=2856608 RepID=UPI001FE4C930|nr:dTMP kinase [Rickettsiella endosymbiont of Dermanyssus gallinae]